MNKSEIVTLEVKYMNTGQSGARREGARSKLEVHCCCALRRWSFAIALLALTACTTTQPVAVSHQPGVQMPKQVQLNISQSIKLKYLLFLPQNYSAASGEHWPLMLFLHGSGERGKDVWKVATHGPPKSVTEHPDFPFILVSPQCPEGELWSNEVLMALLEKIIADYAVD